MKQDIFSDPEVRSDPYPYYAHLRSHAPVAPQDLPFMGEIYIVTRYDDVLEGLKHPALSSEIQKSGKTGGSIFDAWWYPSVFKTLQNSMVLMDDPGHKRLRDLVHKAFSPRRIRALESRICEITDTLLEEMGKQRQVDLVKEFALPIPLTIISDMLAVPPNDRLKFHRWSSGFMEVAAGDPRTVFFQYPNAIRMQRFFKRLIKARKKSPGEDLLSALVFAEESGDRLSEEELISMLFLLLLAGHETTINLIGNGVLALLDYPDQFQLLQSRPELIDSAVEELLRYSNPVEHGNMRYATDDLTLGDTHIPKGSSVMLLLSSANRDETVFENPDELNIQRDPNRHLSFGYGIHYCLGAPLARLEGRIALLKLVQRFPKMRLAIPKSELVWRNTTAVRGLKKLPVLLD